jgi:hypothetical protein
VKDVSHSIEAIELHHRTKHAQETAQKGIGLTTAIGAVLLALATMLANRAHAKYDKLQTEITDLFSSYNSKHGLTHTLDADLHQAQLSGRIGVLLADHLIARTDQRQDLAKQIYDVSAQLVTVYAADKEQESREAEQQKSQAQELENHGELLDRSGDIYIVAELFLQVSIVLCSVALLAESRALWHTSFLSSAAGIVLLTYGLLLH